MKKFVLGLAVLGALSLAGVSAQETDNLNAEISALFSKFESMGHGYYTQAEWSRLSQQMDAIATRAETAKAWDQLVELNRIKAMALGQLMRDPTAAVAVLKTTLTKYGQLAPAKMGRIYALLADNYAQLGNEAEITTLIKEFEQSAYYNAEQYPFSGGQGTEVPLTVTRPAAKGAASIIVTMMERARRKATFGPGKVFPEATLTTLQGQTIALASLRGKVVLVEFWIHGRMLHQRLVQQMRTAYQLHQKDGLEIVSINLEPSEASATLAADAQRLGMNWIVTTPNTELTHKLAIFGDATNFLLDRNGTIVTRDLHEAGLLQSVKDALGVR
ncbi:MAG: TlpA family protein disulfide reductase [Verrucomicrobia bacterium]|nr:MAG: TlpA family protein disulfide reductase [Verrucomicrobiota bacterium]